jgi:Holliday junction resolvase RusA-like endonuclease
MTTNILITVRKFEPKTAKRGKEMTIRKKELRNELIKQNNNLEDIRNNFRDKISIDVCFNLYSGIQKDVSRYKKDLDNMLKIVLDVLKEKMDDDVKELGLGIINDDNLIYEIISRKKLIQNLSEEGIEIRLRKLDVD